MPRKGKSVVKRAGGAIARTAKKVTNKARKMTAKLNPRKRAKVAAAPAPAKPQATPATARPKRAQTDIPLDLIAATYSPRQTSVKASFRSNGADQQNDQEMPVGADDRWQDEDHYTNKSGDARIGTHGRSYEPGETRR
jgi:hypothetical protein